jgi:hypothetical protein
MNRWTVILVAMLFAGFVAMGCSSGNGTPVTPGPESGLTSAVQTHGSSSTTYLWAYYDVTIDTATETVSAVPDRTTQFAANVVTFLNSNPAAMSFNMKKLDILADKVVVDIDVSLTHPFSGMPQFNGYDVRGVFMGDSSANLKYSNKLKYPVYGEDQYQLDDPENGDGGGPDGYTRWFNATEFTVEGLLGYTPGAYGSKNYYPTATVNPYKYFADGIKVGDDAFDFLMANSDDFGVFATGKKNTRNYYLEFPLPTPGATYGYAVVANWEAPDVHPSNAPEAPAAKVTITPDIYYVDGTHKGGNLILDIDVWSWKDQPSLIKVESSVLTAVYPFTAGDMTPIGGGDNYSTYHVEIPANNITHNSEDGGDGDLWVICEYDGYTYTSDVTPPGGAPTAMLAAFFRLPLFIASESYNMPPVADLETPGPGYGWTGGSIAVEFDASGSYDPDPGDILTFTWDFNNDGTFGDTYDKGTDDKPIKNFTAAPPGNLVSVKVTDSKGAFDTDDCTVSLTWFTVPKAKTISLTSQYDYIFDQCIDPTSGDCLLFCYDGYYGQYHYIRRYNMSDGYATYSTINVNTTNWPSYYYWDSPQLIDCDTQGYWSLGSSYPEYDGGTGQYGIRTSTFDSSDAWVSSKWVQLPAYYYTYYYGGDICCMGDNDGTRANDVVNTFAWCTTWTSWYADMYTWASGRQDTAFTNTWSSTYHNPGTGKAGNDELDMQVFHAAEGDPDGDYIWYLKSGYVYDGSNNTPDFRAGKFDVSGTTMGTASVVINSGGNQTTADTGWGYDCYDITIGEQGTVYVLDMWNYYPGTIRVKGFNPSTGASVGGVDVSTSINYPYSYYSAIDGVDTFLTVTLASTYNWPYTWYLWVMTDAETPS